MKFSYSQKKYYFAQIKLLAIPILLLFLSLVILYFDLPLIFKSTAILIGVSSFCLGYFIHPYTSKRVESFDQKIDSVYDKFEKPLLHQRNIAKRGMDGESIVESWLRDLLPANKYTILPNLVLPQNKSDIDFVIIGPKGIFVFEVKNYSEQLFFTTEDYAVILKDGRIAKQSTENDPREQLKWNARRLETYMKNKGLVNVKTKKALIFPEPNSMTYLGSPVIYLIDNKESLKRYLSGYAVDPLFTEDYCNKFIKLLSK